MPTHSLIDDGDPAYPVVNASGAWSHYEAEAAMARMTRSGAQLVTVFAFGCELQADWKESSADPMFESFIDNLPEDGFVVQGFWDNANTRESRIRSEPCRFKPGCERSTRTTQCRTCPPCSSPMALPCCRWSLALRAPC
ncbi:hypothetical protein THIARS_80240 [Thiomonas delicata]|uniref:Uncharacterized protein n=1 Tax=Thiomonas delicata TaxID=364030 RepID=A0A238D8T3_THIDL|nr:hypothetical protein THIARS_80240 [Thiomonas delicata]